MAATRTDSPRPVEWDEAARDVVVGPDPHRSGRMNYRLIEAGLPVWAIVQHIHGIDGETDPVDSTPATILETARDYRITPVEVVAALCYYAENRGFVDAKIDANEAAAMRH